MCLFQSWEQSGNSLRYIDPTRGFLSNILLFCVRNKCIEKTIDMYAHIFGI